MNIFDALEHNKFSYEEIKNKSFISLLNEDSYDINVIIGFRGREEFFAPLIESFENAFEFYNKNSNEKKKFCLTFVEHDIQSNYKNDLKDKVNYLWTLGNVSNQYSRSFAYNFGVKYSNKSTFYLLHDLDILVKENFFVELYQNIKETKCMQTYGNRRVLYLSKELTNEVIKKQINFNLFDENSTNVSLPMYNEQPALGSKGGSILVKHDFYYEIGGFDPELYWGYAAEDQAFWDKAITLLGEVEYADNPAIDMFHMWHPPSSSSNPMLHEMENYMLQYRGMKKKDRIKFLELKRQLFND